MYGRIVKEESQARRLFLTGISDLLLYSPAVSQTQLLAGSADSQILRD